MATLSPQEFPLRFGSPAQFGQIESALGSAGFDEANLGRFFGIASLAELDSANRDNLRFETVTGDLAFYIRVFLLGKLAPRGETERALAPEIRKTLMDLDMIRIGPSSGETYYAPIFLYPVAGLLIASDRRNTPDDSPFAPPSDVVFPAIFAGTLRFLRLIDKSPAEEVLDLCAGSGVGALVLSRHTRRAVASDITARATHFARFNCLLNRCYNVETVQGDLYAGVPDRTFDRITAHPPYVPSLGDGVIFRDGGESGEVVVQHIVEGLPQHLRPGGTGYVLCLGLDTKDGPFEQRARAWLGDQQADFDILFGFGNAKTPPEAVADMRKRAKGMASLEYDRMEGVFARLGAVHLVYGVLVIQRHSIPGRPTWTARLKLSTETEGADFKHLLSWHRQQETPGFLAALSQAKPRLAPTLQVNATLLVQEGALVPAEFVFETNKPFTAAMRFDPWIVPLITQLEGARTVGEIYAQARTEGLVPQDFGVNDFSKLVALLIERGYLVWAGPEVA